MGHREEAKRKIENISPSVTSMIRSKYIILALQMILLSILFSNKYCLCRS